MANSIAQTLGNMQQTRISSTDAGAALPNYQAGTVAASTPPSGDAAKVINSIIDFAQKGTQAYSQYDTQQKKVGDERSNEILAKLTPEQRAQALQDGTLLYQDDPYTMQSLRMKVAQNASLLSDNQVMNNIASGMYKTQAELNDALYNSRIEAGKKAAEFNGMDFNDADFQKGFSSNAAQRNMQVQEAHLQWESGQVKKTKQLHDSVSISGFTSTASVSDPEILAQRISDYINNNPGSDDDKVQLLGQSFKELSGTPGGAQVISRLSNRDFSLYGQQITPTNLYGKEGIDTYVTKAGQSNYNADRASRDSFNGRIQSAMFIDDPAEKLNVINGLEQELERTQPGQGDTEQRQQIQQLKAATLREQAQKAKQAQELFAKQAQQDNRKAVLLDQYTKAANGDTTAITDFNAQSTNEASGKYSKEDSVNAGNAFYEKIMNDGALTPDQKTNIIMSAASSTPKDQGLNLILANKIQQTSTEIASAGLQGNLDLSKTPNLNSMIALYKTNPGAMANAFAGDKDSMKSYTNIATISGMIDSGIDPTIFITGQQKQSTYTEIQKNDLRTNSSKFLTNTIGDTRFKGVAGLPMTISQSIFENTYAATNDVDASATAARKFLSDNVIDVGNSDAGTVGQLLKSSLQVTNDVKSVKAGQDILNNKINEMVDQYPVLKGKLNVSTNSDGTIRITDPSGALRAVTGQPYISITKQDLMNDYRKSLDKAQVENEKKVKAEEERIKSTIGKKNKPTGNGNVQSMQDGFNQANPERINQQSELSQSNDILQGLRK